MRSVLIMHPNSEALGRVLGTLSYVFWEGYALEGWRDVSSVTLLLSCSVS